MQPEGAAASPVGPAHAAARSLEARSAPVILTITAAGAPAFRAVGRVTMATGETRLRIDHHDDLAGLDGLDGEIEVLVTRERTQLRADRSSDWVTIPNPRGTPFDDVVGLLRAIRAGTAPGVTVEVGADGRVARATAATADGRVVVRFGPYVTTGERA
jgi:hypothetical protein